MKRSGFFLIFFFSFFLKGLHHSAGLRSIWLNDVLRPAPPWDGTHIRKRLIFSLIFQSQWCWEGVGVGGGGCRVGMKLCSVREVSVAPRAVGTVMDLTARLDVAQLQFMYQKKKKIIILTLLAWKW